MKSRARPLASAALTAVLYTHLIVIATATAANSQRSSSSAAKNCRQRTRPITSDAGDLYELAEAAEGQKLLTLQCHHCKEADDHEPKIWYKVNWTSKNQLDRVDLGMETNLTANRIFVNPDHTLFIHNVTTRDAGFYRCLGLDGQEEENKYNYLIDVVVRNETAHERGNLTSWLNYSKMYLTPATNMFSESRGDDYSKLRNDFRLRIQVITEWKEWSPCEVCGRPQGQGRKKRKGVCRLKINSASNSSTNVNGSASESERRKPKTAEEALVLNAFQLSCRSAAFGRLFPMAGNSTVVIPNFIQEENCDGICSPDAEGAYKGWKVGKTKAFKYRNSFVLAENSHLTLVCPEANLDNQVVWKKDGKTLDAGESVEPKNPAEEPRITVDTFNTLYLINVKSSEEGNYTCFVDDIRMQQVRIYVVSKSKLLTQAFVRHMMYLGFVLSLTLSCYCAGLFITWRKRHTFKTYEELRRDEISIGDDSKSHCSLIN